MDVIDEFVKVFDSSTHLLNEKLSFYSKEDWETLCEILSSVDALPEYKLPVMLFPPGELKEILYMVNENAKEKMHFEIYSIVFDGIFGRSIYEVYREHDELKVFAVVYENYNEIKKRATPKGRMVLKTWLNYFYGSSLVNRSRIKFAISSLLDELFRDIEVFYLEVDLLFFYADKNSLEILVDRLNELALNYEIEKCSYLYLIGKGKYFGFSKNFFYEGLQEYQHET